MIRLFAALSLIVFLASCGVKPTRLDPPQDADPKAYPIYYPERQTQ